MARKTPLKRTASSKDLILVLLYAKGHRRMLCEPIKGRTRLMKMVFLFGKEVFPKIRRGKNISPDALPDFSPYDFGPFSPQVFNDLEFLVELGFVQVKTHADTELLPEEALEYSYWQAGASSEAEPDEPRSEEEFSLTNIGRQFVEEGEAGTLNDEQWEIVQEFKARCTRVPLRGLLRYIYSKYPRMATSSTIRDEILAEYRY